MRVIDSEYPHLSATQIDVDGDTDAIFSAGVAATVQRIGRRRNRLAQWRLVHRAPAVRSPCAQPND